MPAKKVLLAVLQMLLIGAPSELASAQPPLELDVYWRVELVRQGVAVSSYEGAGFCLVTGIPADCGNDVGLPPNQAHLFQRLCGADQLTFTILPEDGGLRSEVCQNNGPWQVVVTAKLQDAGGNPQGEDFPVNFTMFVTTDTTTHRP